MDIFQDFISNDYKSLAKISDVFKQAEELKYILGAKGYILDHYILMFFISFLRLILWDCKMKHRKKWLILLTAFLTAK